MSSNRLSYDQCSYKQTLKQSVKPINYMLDPVRYYNPGLCSPTLGIVAGTNVTNIKGNLVDLESDLQGRTQLITRCPEYKWKPLTGNEIVSREYTKLNKHAPINVQLDEPLKSCEIIHTKLAQAKEPPLDKYYCNRVFRQNEKL